MKDDAAAEIATSRRIQSNSTFPWLPCTYVFSHLRGLLVSAVEDLLVVVHPDLSQAHLVAGDHLRALGEGVGALGAENVANDGARNDLQLSATLPHLQLQANTAARRVR